MTRRSLNIAAISAAGHQMILTIGEILVEFLASKVGQDFRAPGLLEGPFPSGAPAVFIDQVAQLENACGIISALGRDDFGFLTLARLKSHDVDVSAVQILDDLPTGTAFVRYRESGERDFVFNLKHSACSQISLTKEASALLDHCTHLHIMGSSLFSFRMIDLTKTAIGIVRKTGGTVSFSPNVSKELLKIPEMRAALEYMTELCDLFLPNISELAFLTKSGNEREAVQEMLDIGVPCVVVRQGDKGATYYDAARVVHSPAFDVTSVDRTGAGDCFTGTFISFWLRRTEIEKCLRYANASGALAMLRRGPMEGTSTMAVLDRFLLSGSAVSR
jgi:tagatose kinase